MSGLSTHVLDLAAGRPAVGVVVQLHRRRGGETHPVGEYLTDADGRATLLDGEHLEAGGYRLAFEVGDYFQSSGATVTAPPFLDVVIVDFSVADPTLRHHVPLLVSPFGYSTYRGS